MKDEKGKEGERKTPTSLYCRDSFLFILILFSTSPSLFIVIYYFIIFLFVHIGVCCSILIHPPPPSLPRYPDSAPPVQLLQRASVVRYPPGKFVDCIRVFAWKFKRGTTSAEQPSPPLNERSRSLLSLYLLCGEGR